MLTERNYKKSKKDIGEGSKIFYCCSSEQTEEPCDDCCYDKWTDELKEVSTRYGFAIEDALQLQNRLSIVTDKRNRYKKWLEELELIEEKAAVISNHLEVIASQAGKIWYNACKAIEAIEILFCMIRDFYYQVDEIKKRYDQLQNCINNNTDPGYVKDQGIDKCLKEYYKKLEEVIKTRDELIKAVIESIRLAQLIRNNISTRNCPRNDYDPCKPEKECDCGKCGDFYGFKAVICDWYCEFHCDPEKDNNCDNEDSRTENQTVQPAETGNTNTDPCATEFCQLKPFFDFPLCKSKNYKEYKTKIKGMYDKDNNCVGKLTEDLRKKNKDKESLEACKKSLENAIKEVNPRDRCK